MNDNRRLPAVILAGGTGQRIGGDKAYRLLANKPLWRHVADRVSPQATILAVNGPGKFRGFNTIEDELPGLGPLGGVLAALLWANRLRAKRVLTAAVDTPFLPADLMASLSEPQAPVVVAETVDGFHATSAVWDVALAEPLRTALMQGTRKMLDFTDAYGAVSVRFPSRTPPPFFNINTSQDLVKAEAWLM